MRKFALLAALFFARPVEAATFGDSQESFAAAKVANKVEKARTRKNLGKREREAWKHFTEELLEYEGLHNKLVQEMGAEDTTAAPQALAAAIVAKRAKARRGEVFLPEVQPFLRKLITEQLSGPDTLAARKAVAEGNPGHEEDSIPVLVRVNAVYPVGAARSTVPVSVLLALPPLPPCLRYRFVDRDLILVDSIAQLIVDFLPAVAPVLPATPAK